MHRRQMTAKPMLIITRRRRRINLPGRRNSKMMPSNRAEASSLRRRDAIIEARPQIAPGSPAILPEMRMSGGLDRSCSALRAERDNHASNHCRLPRVA